MEVKPVVAVVTQKLEDTLNEESIADNKVMIHQLKGIQKSLKKLQSFSEEKDVSDESRRLSDHLHVLYKVEDEIETFTFRVARQRKRFGFLMKQTFFFNNLNSCRRLKRKIRKIQKTLPGIPSTSLSSSITSSLHSVHNHDHDQDQDHDDGEDEDHDEGEGDGGDYGTHELAQKSSSAVWPISEIPSTPSPKRALTRSFSTIPNHQEQVLQRKKLAFNYSYNEQERNIIRLKLQYQKQMSSISNLEEELGVFGLNDNIKSLVKRLTRHTRQHEMFVPIVGEEGSGKTTLARAVYKNRKIKDHFDFHDWISVTEEYTAERVLLSMQKIEVDLKGMRYLIVVDGVSSCVFDDLKHAFPDQKNGSKVIFTSRQNSEMIKIDPHVIHRLNEDESWKMFLKKAGKEKEAYQIRPRLKHKILDICNGLPLNIILMAGLLKTKSVTRWSTVIGDGQSSADALTASYNDLSIHSKLCLLYIALFPKDYDIPVRRLLRLWLAEGFVKRRSGEPFPEDLVQKCFEELVDRNMIQITKLRSDNSPRQCRLVSVLHKYLLPKALDISLFYIKQNLDSSEDAAGPFGVRRFVQHINTTGAIDRGHSHGQSPFDPSLLRTYVSFNFQRKDMPEREVGMLLGRIIRCEFGLLRVLDLEGVCKPSLPDNLGHLIHLRYLGLRWTFLESLPESVGDLLYLETLDVKHTRVDSLPDSIWKLKQLRHLNLNNIRLAMPPSSSLTLVTLWGLVLDEKISITEGLGKLLDLRELGIKFNLSKSQPALLHWIAKLVNLQSLRLTSVDDMGKASKLVLKPLMSLNKLSHLNLYGHIERLPALNDFPPMLKVLTLSISRLDEDPMDTLEQLPCLIVLRLLGDSFTGKRMVCRREGFKKLRVLKLWGLKELEEWDVEKEAMESLKELDIRRCYKLNNIPSRLLQKQQCLEELILTNMPDEFVNGIKKRKSKDTSLTVNHWKFTP